MSDFKIFTIEAPLLPPIDGMIVCAANMRHARNKAMKTKHREINMLLARDVLQCSFGEIEPKRQRKINRKAMDVLQSGGEHRFTVTQAWEIADPDHESIKMRRSIRHAMRKAMIAFLRRDKTGKGNEQEPIYHDGKSAFEHGNDYYARHPEMMLKPEFRKSLP